MEDTLGIVEGLYLRFEEATGLARKQLGRPLALTEKILFAHLYAGSGGELPERGVSYVNLRPDRVALQDATAQMALLQFMRSGRSATAMPTTVHCDHLIRAETGAASDLPSSARISCLG